MSEASNKALTLVPIAPAILTNVAIGGKKFSFRRLWDSSKAAVLALFIPVVLIGGIVGGVFTATEASCIAVFYCVVLAFIYPEANLKKVYATIKASVLMFSLSLLCVAAASVWGWVLAYYSIPQSIVTYLGSIGMLSSQALIFLTIIVIFLIVGTFMDAIPAIIILEPIVGKVAAAAGIDPYHMAIVVVLTLAIGLITPPYGLCLLIGCDIGKISTTKAMKAMVPFYGISLAVVLIAVVFPGLIMFIPKLAMPTYI